MRSPLVGTASSLAHRRLMVDDEVPFVGFMAKAGWPATWLRTWIRFAAVHAAMTIADLVDRSTLISAETSARAGIEGDGCLVWRHASSMDVAHAIGVLPVTIHTDAFLPSILQQPACSRLVGVLCHLSSRSLATSLGCRLRPSLPDSPCCIRRMFDGISELAASPQDTRRRHIRCR